MSTRNSSGSHYENHQRANELENLAAHAHRVGEQQGKSEHLTGTEHSRELLQHAHDADPNAKPTVGHNIHTFGHKEITELAHKLWMERGSPVGSPDEDWHEAARQLRAKAIAR